MLVISKPHIPNLKIRLKTAFRDAYDHANALYVVSDNGGQESIYLIPAREFAAGLSLLDTMVSDDRFRTLGDLKHSRNALLRYRDLLNDGNYELQSRQVTALLHDISAIEATEFDS